MPKVSTQTSLRSFFPSKGDPLSKPVASATVEESVINGLDILENFISTEQEQNLLTFLDQQKWRTDLSRRTMHFGGTYCLMPSPSDASQSQSKNNPEIIQAPPIPPEFDDLLRIFISKNIYQPDNLPEYCIVNEYKINHGISAHVENFRFDEPVCSLTLGDGDSMRFHELAYPHDGSVRSGKSRQAERTGKKVDVRLKSRSLVVLRGHARDRWQHEIAKRKKGRVGLHGKAWRRVSLTFRVEKKKVGLKTA